MQICAGQGQANVLACEGHVLGAVHALYLVVCKISSLTRICWSLHGLFPCSLTSHSRMVIQHISACDVSELTGMPDAYALARWPADRGALF